MSEITRGVIGMPFEMAMASELSRRQFYSIAQDLLRGFDRVTAERDALQLRLNAADQRIDELTVPDGYCLMPTKLTAENGAKALLMGEFKLQVTNECPECRELEEPLEGCEICDGEGEYGQQHTISWDQIKFIYSTAVRGLAAKAKSAPTA